MNGKLVGAIAVTLALVAVAPAQARRLCVDPRDTDPTACAGFDTGDRAWDECVVRAYRKAMDECGPNNLECRSEVSIGFLKADRPKQTCGDAKAPDKIPAEDLITLQKYCWSSSSPHSIPNAFIFWQAYGPRYEAKIEAECERIYQTPASKGKRLAAQKALEKREAEFRIERASSPTNGMTQVIIRTKQVERVKCALKDGERYVDVQEVILSPPVDKVVFDADGTEVECWRLGDERLRTQIMKNFEK